MTIDILNLPHTPVEPATIIPPPGRPWTADDLLALADDTHYRYELVRGELRRMSPPSPRHGRYEVRLIVAISKYLESNPIGEVFPGDAGFQWQADPLTIRAPDVAFVAQRRIPPDSVAGFWPLAPDLVVEIISPSESAGEIAEKVSDYLRAGVQLRWLVYPDQQEVQEYRPQQPFHIYDRAAALDGREVLPGFQYALSNLFA
jgi:Uma2 family endonuclease